MSKKIPLTEGQFAIVDKEDYKWLMKWKWKALKHYDLGYVAVRVNKSGKVIHMDRQILGLYSKEDLE